jgi:Glycosyl transferase family 2
MFRRSRTPRKCEDSHVRLVMTVMVRDEADIIVAWVEHHHAQGVDLVIATDNGSVDGTTEILQAYADLGIVELHHDPVHRKQQNVVVTTMARRACTEYGADWVINADADEFWIPRDKSLTLRSALEATPLSLNSFSVPVVNLVGPPARRGSGIDRLCWRDLRSNEQLRDVGIYAQPTDDAVHRGDPDIVVAQGNHFVSLPSTGQPDPAVGLEVLHLPWRSWEQLERKVVQAGQAYESNPDLRPSKNHHGMADYRRHLAGRLWYAFLLRQPTEDELGQGEQDGYYVRDDWLRDHLYGLRHTARCPQLMETMLVGADERIGSHEHRSGAVLGRMFLALERERDDARRLAEENHKRARRLAKERDALRAQVPSVAFGADVARLGRRALTGLNRRLRSLRPGGRAARA